MLEQYLPINAPAASWPTEGTPNQVFSGTRDRQPGVVRGAIVIVVRVEIFNGESNCRLQTATDGLPRRGTDSSSGEDRSGQARQVNPRHARTRQRDHEAIGGVELDSVDIRVDGRTIDLLDGDTASCRARQVNPRHAGTRQRDHEAVSLIESQRGDARIAGNTIDFLDGDTGIEEVHLRNTRPGLADNESRLVELQLAHAAEAGRAVGFLDRDTGTGEVNTGNPGTRQGHHEAVRLVELQFEDSRVGGNAIDLLHGDSRVKKVHPGNTRCRLADDEPCLVELQLADVG